MLIVAIKHPALKAWTEMFNAKMVENKIGGYPVTDPASKLQHLGTTQYSVQISCSVYKKLLYVEDFHYVMSKLKKFSKKQISFILEYFLDCSKSDLLLCANPNAINCTQNWNKVDCGQLVNAKYKNFECKFDFSTELDNFECSNRIDKKELLFKMAPVPSEKTFQARNFNELLSFDQTYIYCGSFNFTFEDFYDTARKFAFEECILNDGTKIRLESLWANLATDFSFKRMIK